ncbi:MAG: IKS protein kinase [Amphiamblys sp. WSBS2006]|nr:MAG: IKS protein kinase [Amphiamblys sp. WSBS2006]
MRPRKEDALIKYKPEVLIEDTHTETTHATHFKTLHVKREQKKRIFENSFNQGYYARFFKERKQLGRGNRGSVFLCRHVLDGISLGLYAVKKIPIGNDHVCLEGILTEVFVLEGLKHENIVDYKHSWIENHQPTSFGPEIPCLFLLMEVANGGSLEDLVENRIALAPDDILLVVEQILSGLVYLHRNGFVHGDIKPSNILLSLPKNGTGMRVLLSDFDTCEESSLKSEKIGTIDFCAPELFRTPRTEPDRAQKADVWSVGLVLYSLYYRELPYKNTEDVSELEKEIRGCAGFDLDADQSLPGGVRMVLKALLEIEPRRRPSAEEALKMVQSVHRVFMTNQNQQTIENTRHRAVELVWIAEGVKVLVFALREKTRRRALFLVYSLCCDFLFYRNTKRKGLLHVLLGLYLVLSLFV